MQHDVVLKRRSIVKVLPQQRHRLVQTTPSHILRHQKVAQATVGPLGERHHTFLFTVDDKVVIDGAVNGNAARFLNHSCDGNCEAIDDRKRIFLEARRNIKAGEELLYDYQYERTDEHTAADEKFYACRCGAAKCRGSILAPAKTA